MKINKSLTRTKVTIIGATRKGGQDVMIYSSDIDREEKDLSAAIDVCCEDLKDALKKELGVEEVKVPEKKASNKSSKASTKKLDDEFLYESLAKDPSDTVK
tara:strand:+ start:6328 stop:6630 length:303 start_codon:yes stop_codon:yes gene_type:complete